MTLTDLNAGRQAAAAKRRALKMSELKKVSGGGDCCTYASYKTGNYRKTTVGFITLAEYEYFCTLCERFFWRGEIEYFQ